ncbi:MAG: class I SAM-dependent methyltransferase [Acidobacteriota bacterium]
MAEWNEQDSSTYRQIAAVAVPRQQEMIATLVAAAPFAADDAIRIVDIGAGAGHLADVLLECFPRATLLALDGSESMRQAITARTAGVGDRIQVRDFALDALDWWDVMHGADLVVSSLCLHHLNDAKKQYLYKAIAERLTKRGALLIADLIEPAHAAVRRVAADSWDVSARAQAGAAGAPERLAAFVESQWNHYRFPDPKDRPAALFHHLVWLKHAGFTSVDCCWLYAGHAVYGGYQSAGEPAADDGTIFERALMAVQKRLG